MILLLINTGLVVPPNKTGRELPIIFLNCENIPETLMENPFKEGDYLKANHNYLKA